MMTLALGPSWLDPNYLLNTFGIWGLLLIVFAESGLLIGFFLPGDSLLFTAGLLLASGQLDFPLWLAIVLICIAAILGDQAGYMFGKKVGPAIFTRPDSRLFKQENVTKAHEFFEKHGPKSLVLARFVPIVRTFTPIVAGVSNMRYRVFLIFNIVGGIVWGAGVTLLGAWLGNIPFVKKHIEAILVLIVFLSVLPIIIEFLRARSQKKKGLEEPAGQEHTAPYEQYQQQADQQPVMDEATTRLRRIEPPYQYGDQSRPQQYPQQPYGDQQDPYGRQSPYGQQGPYGRQDSYGQQEPYEQQAPYEQQDPYGRQDSYEQQDPYGQQSPYSRQGYGRQGHYDHDPQYPDNSGYHRAP